MKARIFRYIVAACNVVMFILAIALPYLCGITLMSLGTNGLGAILSPEVQQHYGALTLGIWCMMLLPLGCAALWILQQIPRWVVMLVQLAQLLVALVVSVFLILYANELDRSLSGVAWDLIQALFGGNSVLATYFSPNFYTHLILSVLAMILGAFAEQETYYEDEAPVVVYEQPRAPAAVIECEGGPFKGEVFPIEPGQTLSFGRDPNECDVVFPADQLHVSRKHCEVKLRPVGPVYEVTCTSTNGMLVGGELCANEQKKTVKKGTAICIGDKENLFVLN